MKAFDKIFFGAIFGAILPVTLFLTGWWGTFRFVPENQIFIYAFSGLFAGIILDFFFVKKLLSNLFNLKYSSLILIYIFYSVCCFGFFMGVPVFSSLLGIPAGYYAARRCIFHGTEKEIALKYINRTALFSVAVILFVADASAMIALFDPFTSEGLRNMLGLKFEITKTMLVLIITLGGILLIIFQYFLTKITGKIIYLRLLKNQMLKSPSV
jgi:hypothetical protein